MRFIVRLFFCVIGVAAVGLLFNGSVAAAIFGPDNYDDCILESMKGVTGDGAAKLVANSCRQKFPEQKARLDLRRKYVFVCDPYTVVFDLPNKTVEFIGFQTLPISKITEIEVQFSAPPDRKGSFDYAQMKLSLDFSGRATPGTPVDQFDLPSVRCFEK